MDKEEKENKKMPEDPVKENTGEEKIQDKAKEAIEKSTDEPKEEVKVQAEEKIEIKKEEAPAEQPKEEKPAEPVEESPKKEEKTKPETPAEKTSSEPKKAEVKKTSDKKTKEPKGNKTETKDKKQKVEHDDDFSYIVRIANTDIDGEKKLIHGLTSIKGVGYHMGALIANELDIDRNIKFGNLNDAQIEKIQKTLERILEIAPGWMLNHRKDYETGEDIHLLGPEIDMRLRDEINIMKKIRSYRGIRHERGLPARGQRTRANNRKGLALGVSKKRT